MTYSVDQILSNDPAIDWRWAGREGLKRCTCQQLREWLRDKTGQAYSTTKKNDLVECVLVYAAKVDTAKRAFHEELATPFLELNK